VDQQIAKGGGGAGNGHVDPKINEKFAGPK